ncbi:sterile alpha motif domain-containing protein 15 isoform X2 [Paramormyrops kingsleyae]|uniref:sterile alpha motif domain-containing protein 15 isoform X2 n=1 Tax=Paramormyrops kingsleyae TaxID=1676925 RepID=UPI000CD5F7FB|nr:sterile alpha motif domain-containing protein 15 isoform X2 [Paramormyrops kingsleyae]
MRIEDPDGYSTETERRFAVTQPLPGDVALTSVNLAEVNTTSSRDPEERKEDGIRTSSTQRSYIIIHCLAQGVAMAAVPVETGTRGKMAAFLHWSCEDVATWIESLGYPQYKLCFIENFIDGKKLLYVNCHYLPRLSITDFEHMKDISRHVRQLLDINEPQWNRSIALPRRDDMGLFLERKSQTGVRADSLTYTQFLGTEKN